MCKAIFNSCPGIFLLDSCTVFELRSKEMILEPMFQQQRKHGSSVLLMMLHLSLLSTIVGTLVVEARSPPEQEVLQPARQATAGGVDRNKLYYKVGDAIPVSCLNRTLYVNTVSFLVYSLFICQNYGIARSSQDISRTMSQKPQRCPCCRILRLCESALLTAYIQRYRRARKPVFSCCRICHLILNNIPII